MDWHNIDGSSNIRRVAHDGKALHIEFNSGAVYAYPDAPDHHLDGIKNAASAGNYFHTYIRSTHTGQRV